MTESSLAACIKACLECAAACETCASACLGEANLDMMRD